MSLYRHHTGNKAVDVSKMPDGLDVTASRTGDRIYLHVVNTNRERSATAKLVINRMKIKTGRIFELAANPEFEVIQTQSDRIVPVKKDLPKNDLWTFPPASVSAVELDTQPV
jgi:alpha-N-arabinofuranosidase